MLKFQTIAAKKLKQLPQKNFKQRRSGASHHLRYNTNIKQKKAENENF